jgi:hypothetical protein
MIPMLNFASAAIIMKLRRHRMQPPFAFIIRVIIESGLIYTLATTVLVCAVFIRDAPNGSEYPMIIICAIVRSTPNGYLDPRYSFWSDSPQLWNYIRSYLDTSGSEQSNLCPTGKLMASLIVEPNKSSMGQAAH